MSKFMDKTMNFMNNKLTPNVQKFTEIPWISGLQAGIMKIVPLTLVSSVVVIYDIVREYIPGLPSMGALSSFTFGIAGLVMAYLIPFNILEKLKIKKSTMGGITGLGLYLMFLRPQATDAGYLFNFDNFGAMGMFVAIIVGLFVAIVFNLFKKISVFGEDSTMPDFCQEWFDVLLPMLTVMLVGWVLTDLLDIDMFSVLTSVFDPVVVLGISLGGVLLMQLIQTLFYTFGVSTWVFYPFSALWNTAIAANIAAWGKGITVMPYKLAGTDAAYLMPGGQGNTLALNFYFLFSKSKRLRTLGKAFIVPSLMNINEPIIFGNVVWNPILMIPALLTTIVNVTATWLAISLGLVMAPHVVWGLWYIPLPIIAFFVGGIPGVLLSLAIIGLDFLIYYPFFKAYEKKVMIEDGELAA